jgi:hypothetical protein
VLDLFFAFWEVTSLYWGILRFKTMVSQAWFWIQILFRIQIRIDPHGYSTFWEAGSWSGFDYKTGSGSAWNLKVGSGSTSKCCKSSTLARWFWSITLFYCIYLVSWQFFHKFSQVREHVIKKGHDRTPAVICECGQKYKGNSSGGIYHHRYHTIVFVYWIILIQ